MTYQEKETSTEDGSPAEAYELIAGTQTFFYTTEPEAVTLGATVYQPVDGLERGRRQTGPDKRSTDFEFEMPVDTDFARIFTQTLPAFRVSCRVLRYHRTDGLTPETILFFSGFVHAVSFREGGAIAAFAARDEISSGGQTAPRRTYQAGCNHDLYNPLTCKVDDTSPLWRAAAVGPSDLTGSVLTIPGLSASYVDNWFRGGYVEVLGNTDYRRVLEHTGDELTLHTPFPLLPSTVNVFAGCNHGSDCQDKFGNIPNIGAFLFVPLEDPHRGDIV